MKYYYTNWLSIATEELDGRVFKVQIESELTDETKTKLDEMMLESISHYKIQTIFKNWREDGVIITDWKIREVSSVKSDRTDSMVLHVHKPNLFKIKEESYEISSVDDFLNSSLYLDCINNDSFISFSLIEYGGLQILYVNTTSNVPFDSFPVAYTNDIKCNILKEIILT